MIQRELTQVECDVLTLVSCGMTNRAIGVYLKRSEFTIKTHVDNIMRVSEVRTRAHLVAQGYRNGYLPRPAWTKEEGVEGEGEGEMRRDRESWAAEIAKAAAEIIDAADPAVLSKAEVIERVMNKLSVSKVATRKYVRLAVERENLYELKPDTNFFVSLPRASGVGVYHTRLVLSRSPGSGTRLVLAEDPAQKMMVRNRFGPGATTYLLTLRRVQEYIEDAVATREAREKDKYTEGRARRQAETREIDLREPGLRSDIQRLDMILSSGDPHENGRAQLWFCSPAEGRDGKVPLREHSLHLKVTATSDKLALLREVINTGLREWLKNQPVVLCRYCDAKILRYSQGGNSWWWHVDTANRKCESAGTNAMPTGHDKESSR